MASFRSFHSIATSVTGGDIAMHATAHNSTRVGLYKNRHVAVHTYDKLDVVLTKQDLLEMKEVMTIRLH